MHPLNPWVSAGSATIAVFCCRLNNHTDNKRQRIWRVGYVFSWHNQFRLRICFQIDRIWFPVIYQVVLSYFQHVSSLQTVVRAGPPLHACWLAVWIYYWVSELEWVSSWANTWANAWGVNTWANAWVIRCLNLRVNSALYLFVALITIATFQNSVDNQLYTYILTHMCTHVFTHIVCIVVHESPLHGIGPWKSRVMESGSLQR